MSEPKLTSFIKIREDQSCHPAIYVIWNRGEKFRYDLEMPSFMLGISHSTQIICILIYCSGVSFFNLTAKHTQKVKNSFSCQIYHSVLVFLNPSNYVFAPFLIPLLFSHCLIHSLFHLASSQGWEFANPFSERIARFLPKNEQMSDLLKKRAICSFAHFWWETWAIRSRSLISSKRPERIAHGSSFLVRDLSDLLTLLIFGERP